MSTATSESDSFRDEPFTWVEVRLRYALTLEGDPGQQMFYSLFLAILAWWSTAITLGLTVFLALLFTTTFFIGLARYVYQLAR